MDRLRPPCDGPPRRAEGSGLDYIGDPIPAAERAAAADVLHRLARGDLSTLHPNATADAAHPFGRLARGDAARPWHALRRAMPDVERRDVIRLHGPNQPDARWTELRPDGIVVTIGSYVGTFREPLVGIPPTHGVAALHYGEVHHVEGGTVRASWLLWDLAGLMIQTGSWPLARPLGAPGHWPAPLGCRGLRDAPAPDEDGAALRDVLVMHRGLDTFDGSDIETIDMGAWAEDFTYWAAGGIGACRGVEGFRAHHQIPYRRAFPGAKGAGHFARISDGPFAATGGDVAVRHTGDDYMGVGASGRSMWFRVMDVYRTDDAGRIAENWLPNDTLGLLAQMGVDVLSRSAHHDGRPKHNLTD